MSVFKCKMCGGDIDLTEGSSVAVCEYCGTKQTVPTADNEKKMTLFARANRLRSACEFDKAASVYESIVADFPEEAEAYWGLVLCRYGIEYVDDLLPEERCPPVIVLPLTLFWRTAILSRRAKTRIPLLGECIEMRPRRSRISEREL